MITQTGLLKGCEPDTSSEGVDRERFDVAVEAWIGVRRSSLGLGHAMIDDGKQFGCT